MQLETLSQTPRTLDLSVRATVPGPPRLAAFGILLIVMGVALAGYSTITALKIHDDKPTSELLIISGLVVALTGLLFVIHTQRKKPEAPLSGSGSSH